MMSPGGEGPRDGTAEGGWGSGPCGAVEPPSPSARTRRREQLLSEADAFRDRVRSLLASGGSGGRVSATPVEPSTTRTPPALLQRLRDEATDEGGRGGGGAHGADRAREVFDRADLDGSGFLDREEVAQALRERGLPASGADVDAIFAAMDANGDGRVSYGEFARAIGEPTVEEIRGKEQWLKQAGIVRALALRLPPGALEQSVLGVVDWGGLLREAAADMAHRAEGAAGELERSIEAKRCAEEVNAKFAASDDLFEGTYGAYPDDFNNGLEAVVGVPSLNVLDAMEKEHRASTDSEEPFDTHYSKPGTSEKEKTTMKLEWEIAVEPEEGRAYPGQREGMKPLCFFLGLMGVKGWPAGDELGSTREEFQLHALRTELAPRLGNDALREAVRAPGATMAQVDAAVGSIGGQTVAELADAQLGRWRRAGLRKEEVIAIRLYTSPAFKRYNGLLRGRSSPGASNSYPSTITAINSALIKLSTVTVLPEGRKVWRGMSGMRLPPSFSRPDEFGCRGGVERGFLSTTTDVEVAKGYSVTGKNPIVWEMDVGQVDRGASISGLSEYPGEAEILFPPLSNLQVVGEPELERRGSDMVTVVRVRVNANNRGQTIDQLEERRKTLHLAMFDNIVKEIDRDLKLRAAHAAGEGGRGAGGGGVEGAAAGVLEECRALVREHEGRDAGWYSDNGRYKKAIVEAVDLSACAGGKLDAVTAPGSDERERREWMGLGVVHFVDRGTAMGALSGYANFPWSEVMAGKVPKVVMFEDMGPRQVELAWRCIHAGREGVREVSMGKGGVEDPFGGLDGALLKCGRLGASGTRLLGGLFKLGLHAHVTTVNLMGSGIGADGASMLTSLGALTGLTTLHLGSNKIGADGAGMLTSLGALSSLTVLNLSTNEIGAAGASKLTSLGDLRALRLLVLESNNMGADGAGGLTSLGALTGLTSLDLANNRFEGDAAARLSSLCALTGMVTLDLRSNDIGADGAGMLAWLRTLTGLTTLDLSANGVGAEGAGRLSSLCALKGLVSLDLRANSLGADGAGRMAWLGAMTGLTKLNLRSNDIGADGVGMLSSLGALSSLTELNLRSNFIGADGAAMLTAWLGALTGLTCLNLRNNSMGADGALALTALRALTALSTLDLRFNGVGEEGDAALRASLPRVAAMESTGSFEMNL